MKVGLAVNVGVGLDSVPFVARTVEAALRRHHQVHTLPLSFPLAPAAEQLRMAREFVESSDAIVGFHSTLEPLLSARAAIARVTPCVIFALGAFPRGGVFMRRLAPYLTTADVVIVNSAADGALAAKFFSNTRVECIPLAYDDTHYGPLEPDDRLAARRELGYAPDDAIVLYAGRLTVQKNLHSLVRVFGAVARRLPRAHLMLAGPISDDPFPEFGIVPIGYGRLLLERLVPAAGVRERIRYLGPIPPPLLRRAYCAADVVMNLTLHHDENFGLAQVEATACGTPVVGTAWGGLRDTIREGGNGLKVGTTMTPHGVRFDWWEAVNKTASLLRSRITEPGRWAACQKFAQPFATGPFGERLAQVMSALAVDRDSGAPIEATPFANLFWALCAPGDLPYPEYVHGTHSFDLYCELLEPYTERSTEMVGADEPMRGDQVVTMPSRLRATSAGELFIDDPLYAFTCNVPNRHRESVTQVARALEVRPVQSVAMLHERIDRPQVQLTAAMEWMACQGLLTRSLPSVDWMPYDGSDNGFIYDEYVSHIVDRGATDFVVFRDTMRML
jgi:glycosyltransferase involved in cell wall biosynthesis